MANPAVIPSATLRLVEPAQVTSLVDGSAHAEPVPEKLLTIKAAAAALGLPTFKVNRAARAGLIPTYTLLNSRRLVRLSEIIAVINSTRSEGSGH
jgi:hypothetical protein